MINRQGMPIYKQIKACSLSQLDECLNSGWALIEKRESECLIGKIDGYMGKQVKIPIYNMSALLKKE